MNSQEGGPLWQTLVFLKVQYWVILWFVSEAEG